MRHIFSFLRVALLIYIFCKDIAADKRQLSDFWIYWQTAAIKFWQKFYKCFIQRSMKHRILKIFYLPIFLTYVLACVPTTAFSTIRISNSYREQGDGGVEKSTHTHTRNRNLHIYHEFMGDIWFSYFHYFLVRDKRNTCEPITVWIISHEYDRINHIIMEVIW